ncbi:Phosphatidic acid phosphatase type 2/haloperoxidase [Penicillium hispanicum]|uniref:Phosphatidic acid phosphatase type 2/haloperoxidase n=1 Tax=Penicillium hispanicum TaxID=1080232 RepID=UPI002540898D|nr:Phosphatidic acid phosphatase type 2/haloperoxidase [Penicillium hispanicum]KAJ5570191.1 Phosphatidic acid phosphatase type 2/haloperoxidase [Penicillium hispanicum]
MGDTPLASLSLTHVHYNPEDPLSFVSAWLALLPQALCVSYTTLIWATRETEVILMFVGQMGCEALNFLLKRIIKEERPKAMFGKGYGMPSSHAQFMAFFAVYLTLFLVFRHTPAYATPYPYCGLLLRAVATLGLCVGAAAVASSRIYLNYHTPRQVLVGCGAGVGCAFGWFAITGLLRRSGWIDWALELTVTRLMRIRDLLVSEDLAEAGWQQWEARRLKRRYSEGRKSEPITMDMSTESGDSPMQEHHIVKADEVDQTGTDISTISDDQLMEEMAEGLRQERASPAIPTRESSGSSRPQQGVKRPELRREGSAPPPPLQPPPPAPVQQNIDKPADSLSLAQLRRLVQEMPKIEQPAYAFEYADCQPFPDELNEWFQYNDFDRVMLMGMKTTFDRQWSDFCHQQTPSIQEILWLDSPEDLRRSFVTQSLEKTRHSDISVRLEALENLCYVVTGVWGLTAGRTAPDYPEMPDLKTATETPPSKSLQLAYIEQNVLLVQQCAGIPLLVKRLCELFDRTRTPLGPDSDGIELDRLHPGDIPAPEREANLVLTLLYFAVEVGRRQESRSSQYTSIRDALAESEPCLLVTIVEIIARLRWDETANIPLTRIILLLWKSLLLVFGGSGHLKKTKEILEPVMASEENLVNRKGPFLHASPLDYHQFRQEITSKYPAYNPPPPVVPLELENNSILPPLPQHPSRSNSSSGLFCGVGPSIAGGNGSILQQSVHIATPAPSPPPSPIGPGGKAGKKQNYQTNQNFPLMYPPLDDTSNRIGGKGTTERQDVLVGKRWEGSDVPASIIEAGRLFSTHVKMTRAMQQLWEERENFMKYDRGWNLEQSGPSLDSIPIEDLRREIDRLDMSTNPDQPPPKQAKVETDDQDVQRRLDAVERFYAHTLSHLQSITIVFLKIILTNVSAVVNQAGPQASQSMRYDLSNSTNEYSQLSNVNLLSNGHSANGSSTEYFSDASVDELDNIRLREITSKAVSGTLLLLVKWFKRSHVLKFEYMTQLLLDSNYLPLILKMFAHQDVDQAVAQKNDRDDLSFFHFCRDHSDFPYEVEKGPSGDTESDDEAVPPPISRQRPNIQGFSPEDSLTDAPDGPTRPEVDELGYPTAPLPKEPITVFSFRNFFSAINYLHIMQKITRDKAHRCLLLVQYKSSTILRKGLKIPDPHLRFYTLKLFKSQVPYCGRKWRQSNMRVITAIYLYCRPELRDDWLAGSDVDAEVEEALPLEQALRGLTHWWHLRQYKDVMGGPEGTSMMEEERDFFVRELESMGWGFAEEMEDSDVGNHMVNGTEWEGGLQMEGWS